MKRFTSISMRNFMGYGNATTVVNLDRKGTTLIRGEDLDNTGNGATANGVGKASWVNAMIKTPTGWVRMGDVVVGTMIQAPDGTSVPVVGVYPQGNIELYRVTFSDGRSTVVSADHLWQIHSRKWSGNTIVSGNRVITTSEMSCWVTHAKLKNDASYSITVPTVAHPNIPDIELPIDPYFLGVLIGDGILCGSAITLTSVDQTIIDELDSMLRKKHNQRLVEHSIGSFINGYDWDIKDCDSFDDGHNPNSIQNNLVHLGLYGMLSTAKFIPPQYIHQSSERQKLALLAGLLDTDGTVGKTKNVNFCTMSVQLALDVQYIIRSLGGKATITNRNEYHTNEHGVKVARQLLYNVSIQLSNPRTLFRLPSKLALLATGNMQDVLPGLRVDSVEFFGHDYAQCIMIDHPDHLYITDDFIVTHNTTILRAVLYAGYNETLSDMSVDQLINDVNKKEMEVSLDWIDEDTNTTYRAVRYRKMKHGNGIKFYVNGEDKTVAKGTDELIAAAIGMPFDVFVRIAIFSASYQPFLNMPTSSTTGASQRSIMEELFGLTELSDRAVSVKVAIKDLESDLKLKLATVTQAQREVQRHTDQITSAKRRVTDWYNQTDATIDRMRVTLKSVQNVDIDGQQALHKERDHLRPFLAPLQTTTRDLQRTYDQIANHIKTANGQLLSLHDSTCPYCLQEYKGASEKVDQLTIDVGEFTAESARVVGVLSENKIEVAELKSKIDDISAQITVEDVDSLIKTRANAETTKTRMLELAETINPHEDTLAELMATVIEPVSTEEIDRLENELEHAKFLLKILTKPDSFVRKALLAKNLPFLNSRLKVALLELGLPYQVEFQPDMTATLRHSRGNIRTFAQLSTGQAARVNLALAFAFADVRYRLHGKINICLLDEVLDVGLDPVGVQLAAKLIKIRARESGIAHFIITHREEALNMFDAKLTVQMSQGFSSIIDDSMIF